MIKPVNPVVNWAHPLAQGLVAAYPLQDGGGLVARDATGQHDAAMTGMELDDWVRCSDGYALRFDDSNDMIDTGAPLLGADYTVSMWVYLNTYSALWQPLLEQYAGGIGRTTFMNRSSSYMEWYVNPGYNNASPIPENVWTHMVCVKKGVKGWVYYNGVLNSAGSSLYAGAAPAGANTHIGHHGTQTQNGQVKDFRLWSRPLIASEVADLYARPWDLYKAARPVRELYRGEAAVAPPTLTSVVPAEGADVGGTEIVLTGTNFASITSVTIGGVAAADFTVVSPTSIEATTDEGAVGQSDIVVVGLGGTATLAGGFEYLASETEAVYSAATIAEQTLPLPTGDHTEGAVFPRAAPSNFDGVIDIPAAEYKAVEPLSPRPDGSIDGISGGTGTNSVVDHRNAPFKLNKKPDYRNL